MGELSEKLFAQKPPATLYHYTTQEGLIGILSSKTLWASKMQYLNDASEFLHAVNLAKPVIVKRKQAPKSAEENTLLKNIEGALKIISPVHLFIGSLSEVGNLLSQWRGYCPEGNGFSIGLNTEHLQTALVEQDFILAPCIYEPVQQEKLVSELLDDALGFRANPENIFSSKLNPGLAKFAKLWGPQASFFVREFLKLGSLLKHHSFNEEREWRILCLVIPHTHPDFKVRPGKSMLIPYREVKMHNNDGFVYIDELIVGPTPHTRLATQSARNFVDFLAATGINATNVRPSEIPYRTW